MTTRYSKIAQWVRDRIADSTYPPGATIPAIPELANRFDVSRETVRDAISRLTNEGVVTPRRGIGTVVRDLSPVSMTYQPGAPAQLWTTQNSGGSDTLISAEWEAADRGIAERLELPADSQVVHRVRHQQKGDGIAQVHHTWIPQNVALALGQDVADASSQPTTDVFTLMRQAGNPPATITETVSTRMPTPEERELMDLPAGVPLLVTHRITRNSDSTPLETSTLTGAGDRMAQTFTVPME